MNNNENVSPSAEAVAGFDKLGLPEKLVRAAKKLGFDTPSEIQALTIPTLLLGQDVTGIAQTGTGKTAAFGFPMLVKVLEGRKSNRLKGLVLCPTRELAGQTANAIGTYAAEAGMHDFSIVAIYGGAAFVPQKKAVEAGADVIVATPGRLIDMIERKIVNLEEIEMTVLDEADEMLKMGFVEDIETILGKVKHSQTCLFSATMPPAIAKISQKYQNDPVSIRAQKVASTNTNISQSYAIVPFSKKTEATRRLIINSHAKAAIVFVKTRATASQIAEELSQVGISATAISGDVPQNERERIVEGMRKGRIKVLVATDVAARGLDIKAIELVVNFDLPTDNDSYVHRIGRTGRAGREGSAVSLVNPSQKRKLKSIENLIGMAIDEIQIPTLEDVATEQVKLIMSAGLERMEKGNLEKYSKTVAKKLAAFSSDIELINFVSSLIALSIGDQDGRVEREQSFTEGFSEGAGNGGKSGRGGNGRGRGSGNRDGGSRRGGFGGERQTRDGGKDRKDGERRGDERQDRRDRQDHRDSRDGDRPKKKFKGNKDRKNMGKPHGKKSKFTK